MTNPTLERAVISVEEELNDAFFESRENDPRKIARAVLMAVRNPGHNGSVWDKRHAAIFTDKIDAILGAKG